MIMIVKTLKELEAFTGIRLMSTELEIISVLYHEGPISVQVLMSKVRASPSGFHLIKKCMQDTGLIVGCRSESDARVKLLDLSPELRSNLAAIYEDLPAEVARNDDLGHRNPRHTETKYTAIA